MVDSAGGKGKVTVKKANQVTIEVGGVTYVLDIAGAKKGETDFTFANHTLSKTSKPAMAFITPPAAAAAFAASELPTLTQAGQTASPAANGWTIPARPPVAPIHQFTATSQGILQPGITLHANGNFF